MTFNPSISGERLEAAETKYEGLSEKLKRNRLVRKLAAKLGDGEDKLRASVKDIYQKDIVHVVGPYVTGYFGEDKQNHYVGANAWFEYAAIFMPTRSENATEWTDKVRRFIGVLESDHTSDIRVR